MSPAAMKLPERRLISLDAITVEGPNGPIRRPRATRVAAIAKSMAELGQRTPIELCPIPNPRGDAEGEGRYRLITGWVRLEAATLLGWNGLEAVVTHASSAERHKREIDDNLLQDGTTVLDRARYLAAGKFIYEAENPETRHGGVRRGDQVANIGDLKPYASWAAERYGLALRSIQRACTIGEYLHLAAAKALADSAWADNQQALEALCRLKSADQVEVALRLTRIERPVTSMAEAIEQVVGCAPVTPAKKRWSAATSNFAAMAERQRTDWLRHLVEDDLLPSGVSILFQEKRS